MEIIKVRHNWPEKQGFSLHRPQGSGDYVLLHFHNAVEIMIHGTPHHAQPGAFIILSPATGHGFHSEGPLLHDWMHLSGEVKALMSRYGLQPDTLYQPRCGIIITETIALLESEFFARHSFWNEMSLGLFTRLLILISRDLAGETDLPVSIETADRLRALRAEMVLHPEAGWSNPEMAHFVNLSESRLYPLYKRMFSISPNQDLILIRVEKAKNMLSQGESVTNTAEKLGYTSIYHFIRQFRQITGITPGQYNNTPRHP